MIGSGSESESPGKPVARLGQSWVPAWGRPFECLLGPAVRRGSLAVAFSHLSDGRSVVPTASRMFAFARVAEESCARESLGRGLRRGFLFWGDGENAKGARGLAPPSPRRWRSSSHSGGRGLPKYGGRRWESPRTVSRLRQRMRRSNRWEGEAPPRAGEKAIARLKISGWYPNSARTVSGRRCLHMPYSIGRAAPSFPNPPREDGWLSPHIRVFGDLA